MKKREPISNFDLSSKYYNVLTFLNGSKILATCATDSEEEFFKKIVHDGKNRNGIETLRTINGKEIPTSEISHCLVLTRQQFVEKYNAGELDNVARF